MFYEWSQVKKSVDRYDGYNVGDEVYFPHPTKKKKLKGKIVEIIIDGASPEKEMSFIGIIIKTGLKNFFKKYKIKSLKYISTDYKKDFNYRRWIEEY